MEPVVAGAVGAKKARLKRRNRLSLRTPRQEIEVIELWNNGFAIARDAPRILNGFVDIFEGSQHLFRGLAYPMRDESDRRIFAFKIAQRAGAEQPRDYASRPNQPVALIPSAR